MPHDVFVSYSSKDKPTADALVAVLERNDIRCWIAPRDIAPGADWGEAIIAGIQNSRVFVLIFSSLANSSPQIKREVERAVNRELPVIPFRIEEVAPVGTLEYFISSSHWLDAFSAPLDQHLQDLVRTIKPLIRSELISPSATPATAAERVPPVAEGPKRASGKLPLLAGIACLCTIAAVGGWLLAGPRKAAERAITTTAHTAADLIQPPANDTPARPPSAIAAAPTIAPPSNTPASGMAAAPFPAGTWQVTGARKHNDGTVLEFSRGFTFSAPAKAVAHEDMTVTRTDHLVGCAKDGPRIGKLSYDQSYAVSPGDEPDTIHLKATGRAVISSVTPDCWEKPKIGQSDVLLKWEGQSLVNPEGMSYTRQNN